MNDEQSKRLSEAADAVLQASEALDDARETLADKRFESEIDRDRMAAGQQMANKLESAGKKISDAVRKGTIAAAALGGTGAYGKYCQATAAVREGRSLARTAAEQDGAANKRARGQEALTRLEESLKLAAAIVFGE